MTEIFRAEIDNPPVSITFSKKDYPLTENIFYGGVKPFIRTSIVHKCKEFLLPFLENCPSLSNPPYSSVLQYCAPSDVDLDNKCFFWRKLLHDMLTRKTGRDNENSIKLGRVKDDNTKYFDCNGDEYYKTHETKLIFIILKNS